MNEQDFLVHLDINKFNINQESLIKEVLNQAYLKYSNFFNPDIYSMDKTIKWLMEVEDWQACDIDLENNLECKKFYTQIKKLLDVDFLEVTTCRSLYQKANQELIKHSHRRVPRQNHLCINYICTNNNAPINFTKYGDITYKFALLNSVEQHSVPAYKEDRFLIGVQFRYIDDIATWQDVKELLKNVSVNNKW